jgi:8-oxo-dGTP diphosphatase / 2-hydroxy-dATP diphosphatase
MKKQLTLCMVLDKDKVLLGMKKIGFGAGRWNGFGGKVEQDESLEAAAKRELLEEAGIVAHEIRKVGNLEFSFESESKVLEVHIFKTENFSGEPTESEEMTPKWFTFDEVPFQQMWTDDEHWFPFLLQNKIFKGKFHFDRPSDAEYAAKILKKELYEVENL